MMSQDGLLMILRYYTYSVYINSYHHICIGTSTHAPTTYFAEDVNGVTFILQVVLRDMAKIHALFMDKVDRLSQQSWMDHSHSCDVAIKIHPLWKAMLVNAAKKFPEFWTTPV